MTLEITQAGSLAPDKTHRSLRKARLRLRERSAAQGFAHYRTQSLSRGQFLSDKHRAGFGGGRIMNKREKNLVLQFWCWSGIVW